MMFVFDGRSFSSSDAGDGSARTPSREAQSSPSRPSRTVTLPPELVERVRARDVDAVRELIRSMYVPLVRFAGTIVRSQDEAEDTVQDVLVAIWSSGNVWNPGTDAVAYLYASVRNQALKEIRRRQRAEHRAIRVQTDMPASPYGAGADPADSVLDRVVEAETDEAYRKAITAVLETCTERQRTAYDLRYNRGLTVPAIATVLGITGKSAEQLVRRVTHLVLDRLRGL